MCIRDSDVRWRAYHGPEQSGARRSRPAQRSAALRRLSLIHISEPTRLLSISYAVFCLKKKKKKTINTLHILCSCYVATIYFFFLMIRRPPRSTLDRSSAASDVYKRQVPASSKECCATT